MALYSPSQINTTTFHLSDSLEDLEMYFIGDLVGSANQLMAEKVDIALEVLGSAPSNATSITVNSNETQIVGDYATNGWASWKGDAKLIINGTGLSADSSDGDFTISDISVLLTSSDSPIDWSNPLFEVDIGLELSVVNGEAQTFRLSSFVVKAGDDMKVSFTGLLGLGSLLPNTNLSPVEAAVGDLYSPRIEVVFDSDPSDAVVLSTLYLETEASVGKVALSGIGATNEAGHYLYSDDLNIVFDVASNEVVFGQTSIDTLHTYGSVELTSELENVVMEGSGNISITANRLNNHITTNDGSNMVSAMSGNDIVDLIPDSVWNGYYFAKNASNELSIGTNEEVSVNGLNRFNDVIDGGDDIDTINLTSGHDAFFVDDVFSDHHSSLNLSSTIQGVDSTARVVGLEVINAGGGDDVIDLTSTNFILSQGVVINGETGNDTLWGSNGHDVIDGGEGNDTLFGGAGDDTLTGGDGDDVFHFTPTAGSNVISDFDVNGDSIKLYYGATDKHTNADIDLTDGILTWDAGNTNNVLIDISTTTTLSGLNDIDSLITFVEIV